MKFTELHTMLNEEVAPQQQLNPIQQKVNQYNQKSLAGKGLSQLGALAGLKTTAAYKNANERQNKNSLEALKQQNTRQTAQLAQSGISTNNYAKIAQDKNYNVTKDAQGGYIAYPRDENSGRPPLQWDNARGNWVQIQAPQQAAAPAPQQQPAPQQPAPAPQARNQKGQFAPKVPPNVTAAGVNALKQ